MHAKTSLLLLASSAISALSLPLNDDEAALLRRANSTVDTVSKSRDPTCPPPPSGAYRFDVDFFAPPLKMTGYYVDNWGFLCADLYESLAHGGAYFTRCSGPLTSIDPLPCNLEQTPNYHGDVRYYCSNQGCSTIKALVSGTFFGSDVRVTDTIRGGYGAGTNLTANGTDTTKVAPSESGLVNLGTSPDTMGGNNVQSTDVASA